MNLKQFILLFFLIHSFSLVGQKTETLNIPAQIGFIKNEGQIMNQFGEPNLAVKYLLQSNKMNIQLREGGFSYDFYELDSTSYSSEKTENVEIIIHRIDFDFIDINPDFKIVPIDEEKSVFSFYRGYGEFMNIKKASKIVYENIYPNIDIEFKVNEKHNSLFEYDFIIKPGGNVDDIRFNISGGDSDLAEEYIKIQTRFGVLQEVIPESFYIENLEKINTEIHFKKWSENTYGFQQASEEIYIFDQTLLIDPVPVRKWGTYFGTDLNYDFFPREMQVRDDKLYVIGGGGLTNFATSGTYQTTYFGAWDGVLFCLDTDGFIEWFTYFGGIELDVFTDFEFDDNNHIIVSGYSRSNWLSTLGTHQTQRNGWLDGIIVKFNMDGTRVWSTYFGGEENDHLETITTVGNDIYVAGNTLSHQNIATPGAHQEVIYGNVDGYYAKFSPDGQNIWSSYYGGTGGEEFLGIDHDGNNHLTLIGKTSSQENISHGDVHGPNLFGQIDSFLLKINHGGERIWATYVGGENRDELKRIDHDAEGNIYIAGKTSSVGIGTEGTYQPDTSFPPYADYYSHKSILRKYDNTGNLVWSTYFTGNEYDMIEDLVVNEFGIYIAGTTTSSNLITTENAYSGDFGGLEDGFIAKFDFTGNIDWSTYYGGDKADYIWNLAVKNDIIYIAGASISNYGISTPNTFNPRRSIWFNPYFVKFKECETDSKIEISGDMCRADQITLSASGGSEYNWYTLDGFISSGSSIQVDVTNELIEYFVFVENGDCSEVLSIPIKLPQNMYPHPIEAEIEDISTYCSYQVLSPPTATHPCDGEIVATTLDPLFYDTPGNYIINWTFEDSYGNITRRTQFIFIDSEDNIFFSEGNLTVCPNETINLNSALSSMTYLGQDLTDEVLFFESQEDIDNDNPIQNPQNYQANQNDFIYVVYNNETCLVQSQINLNLFNAPVANDIVINKCSPNQDGFAQINLNDYLNQISDTGNTIQFFTDIQRTQQIEQMNITVQDQEEIYVLVSSPSCTSEAVITISLSDIIINNLEPFIACDENNGEFISSFNLLNIREQLAQQMATQAYNIYFYFSQVDAINHMNPLPLQYENIRNPQIIYASSIVESDCPTLFKIELIVNESLSFNPQNFYEVCPYETVEIGVENIFNEYSWSDGSTTPTIFVETPGEYQITVSENSCSATETIHVAHFNEVTFDMIIHSNSAEIQILSGDFPFQFQWNNSEWNSQNIFYNLEDGDYNVSVKDKNNCVYHKNFSIVKVQPNFISPNNDGKNDFIHFKKQQNDTSISIFDVYGKLIFKQDFKENNIITWDGKKAGAPLPTGTYYFLIYNEDQIKSGFITLKNY